MCTRDWATFRQQIDQVQELALTDNSNKKGQKNKRRKKIDSSQNWKNFSEKILYFSIKNLNDTRAVDPTTKRRNVADHVKVVLRLSKL